VAGFDVSTDPLQVSANRHVPESAALYESLTAREFLDVIGSLYHQPRESARQRIDELLDHSDSQNQDHGSASSQGHEAESPHRVRLMHRPRCCFSMTMTGLDANAALSSRS
jgi:ABC-type multidrug transport system ATPase subunit